MLFSGHMQQWMYKPVFHPFLDPARERSVLSFVFLSISKRRYWFFVCFLFLMEKTNPVLILTKCILHMCEACFCSGPFSKGEPRRAHVPQPGPALWPCAGLVRLRVRWAGPVVSAFSAPHLLPQAVPQANHGGSRRPAAVLPVGVGGYGATGHTQ